MISRINELMSVKDKDIVTTKFVSRIGAHIKKKMKEEKK